MNRHQVKLENAEPDVPLADLMSFGNVLACKYIDETTLDVERKEPFVDRPFFPTGMASTTVASDAHRDTDISKLSARQLKRSARCFARLTTRADRSRRLTNIEAAGGCSTSTTGPCTFEFPEMHPEAAAETPAWSKI